MCWDTITAWWCCALWLGVASCQQHSSAMPPSTTHHIADRAAFRRTDRYCSPTPSCCCCCVCASSGPTSRSMPGAGVAAARTSTTCQQPPWAWTVLTAAVLRTRPGWHCCVRCWTRTWATSLSRTTQATGGSMWGRRQKVCIGCSCCCCGLRGTSS